MAKKLTNRELSFVDEFMKDFNPTHAIKRAGYNCSNYNTQKSMAAQLMARPHVIEAINAKRAVLSAVCGVSAERTINELGKIAFSNIEDLWDFKTGKIKDGADLSIIKCIDKDIYSPAIKGIKMHDKLKAIELLCKYLNITPDNINVNLDVSNETKKAELLKMLGETL
jgi:phage terminase small subunit